MENVATIDVNTVKKDLYKSKAMAKFSHYVSGNIYYKVDLEDGTYQFPMSTVERTEFGTEETAYRDSYNLSSDLGTTPFYAEMKGSDLNRWIAKAIKSGEFVKVS
jgi:hypothetical protein